MADQKSVCCKCACPLPPAPTSGANSSRHATATFSRTHLTSLGWLIAAIGFLCRALPLTWATLAIYYSNLPWAGLRIGLAIAFAAFAVWAVWFSRQRRTSMVVIVLFFGVVAWWISIRPSLDRNWRPEVAIMPRAVIDGDHVRLTGVRNFDYRSPNEAS